MRILRRTSARAAGLIHVALKKRQVNVQARNPFCLALPLSFPLWPFAWRAAPYQSGTGLGEFGYHPGASMRALRGIQAPYHSTLSYSCYNLMDVPNIQETAGTISVHTDGYGFRALSCI
jgi:hypothetical protein